MTSTPDFSRRQPAVREQDPPRNRRNTAQMVGWGLRTLGYGASVLPVGVAALAVSLVGHPAAARRWWAALPARVLGRPDNPARARDRPGAVDLAVATAGHAVLSVLLGAVCWVLLGVLALVVTRGAFYGLVTDGSYAHSWGGPTLAGAWTAHFFIGLPIGVAAVVLLRLVAHLHLKLGARLRGQGGGAWVVPVSLLLAALGALFVVAWTRQI